MSFPLVGNLSERHMTGENKKDSGRAGMTVVFYSEFFIRKGTL